MKFALLGAALGGWLGTTTTTALWNHIPAITDATYHDVGAAHGLCPVYGRLP